MQPYATPHLRTAVRNQSGVSLIELMISLTIGMVLLLGISTLILQQSSARDELDKSSRQIENGRYAMQILHDAIEHAGFYGTYSPPVGIVYTTPPDPCVIAFGSTNSGWDTTPTSVPVAVYGYAGAPTNPVAATSCGLTNYQPNTAILVVRHTATTPPVATAVVGATYLQVSDCNTDTRAFVYGTSGFNLKQKDCATPALLNPYFVDVYYISSCNVCGTDNTPTLKMVQSGAAAAPGSPTPLAEGIESMQFDYGIDNTGSGAPDNFIAIPAMGDWQNVMSIRVNLLARNIDPSVGYTDSKIYDMGKAGATGPFNAPPNVCGGTASFPQLCNYKRHLYNELVRVINPSGLREKP